jgi:hypothetical protein
MDTTTHNKIKLNIIRKKKSKSNEELLEDIIRPYINNGLTLHEILNKEAPHNEILQNEIITVYNKLQIKLQIDKFRNETQKLYGVETITYTNNSPDRLDYLWLQLDQNIYAENSDSKVIEIEKMENFKSIGDVRKKFFYYDGGFKFEYIKSTSGQQMRYAINKTMLRIDLDKPLLPNTSISFQIKWMYNINDRMAVGGRSGYEYFEKV